MGPLVQEGAGLSADADIAGEIFKVSLTGAAGIATVPRARMGPFTRRLTARPRLPILHSPGSISFASTLIIGYFAGSYRISACRATSRRNPHPEAAKVAKVRVRT